MRVLIADDESVVRRALQRAFKVKGHEVLTAENGTIAIEQWQSQDPHLVVLDVLMPDWSGPEVLKAIGEENRAKVILISAYTGDYDMNKALSLGADLFIAKPFHDIFEVVTKAEELIRG